MRINDSYQISLITLSTPILTFLCFFYSLVGDKILSHLLESFSKFTNKFRFKLLSSSLHWIYTSSIDSIDSFIRLSIMYFTWHYSFMKQFYRQQCSRACLSKLSDLKHFKALQNSIKEKISQTNYSSLISWQLSFFFFGTGKRTSVRINDLVNILYVAKMTHLLQWKLTLRRK